MINLLPDRDHSVFISCPHGYEFRDLRHALTLAVIASGHWPVSNFDSFEPRMPHIPGLGRDISRSKYSIHECTRCDGSNPDEFGRFNVPIELGIALFERQRTVGSDSFHEIYVLVRRDHSYRRFLSALTMGLCCPYSTHLEAMKAILNWLCEMETCSHKPKFTDVRKVWDIFSKNRPEVKALEEGADDLSKDELQEQLLSLCREQSWWKDPSWMQGYACPGCGTPVTEQQARLRLQDGFDWIRCSVCSRRFSLPALEESVTMGRVIDARAEAGTVTESVKILHLSDLHMKPEADPESMLQPLIADLRDKEEGLGLERLDYLVVSGDLGDRARPEEFDKARVFISELIEHFGLTVEHCILVPGNHDLDWEENVYVWKQQRRVSLTKLKPGSYVEQGAGFLVRRERRYPFRFKNFVEIFYKPLTGQAYPLKFKEQCVPSLFPEAGIQFLAMNSCWEIDEYFPGRSSIHAGALSRGLDETDKQIEQAKAEGQLSADASVLRIAVWHHPVTGNDKIEDDAFLERLRQADVKLCLHGHVHEERADLIGYLHPTRKLYVAGAGSFGAPVCDRPEAIPRLYNVLEVTPDHSRIRVHTRCLRKETGAWEGWAVWPGEKPTERRTYYDIPPRSS